MHSAFLQMLHEERWKEVNKGTKRSIIVTFFPELAQTFTQLMYYCCRLLLSQRHSACHVQCLSTQHIYCTNTVHSATELYLQ